MLIACSKRSFSFGILLQHFEEQPNAITSVLFGIAEYPVTLRQQLPPKITFDK